MGPDKTLTFDVTVQHPTAGNVQDTATVTVTVTGQFTNFKISSKLFMFKKLTLYNQTNQYTELAQIHKIRTNFINRYVCTSSRGQSFKKSK